jgi:hypothetical protein
MSDNWTFQMVLNSSKDRICLKFTPIGQWGTGNKDNGFYLLDFGTGAA